MEQSIFIASRGIIRPLLDRYQDIGRVKLHVSDIYPDDIQLTNFDNEGFAEFNVEISKSDFGINIPANKPSLELA